MKTARKITLTEEERTTLNVWLRLHTPTRLALRAKIVLLAADGKSNQEIAGQLRASPKTVLVVATTLPGGPVGWHRKGGPPQQAEVEGL